MSRRRLLLLPLALLGLAASPYVAWEDLTEADWLYPLATRVADLDGAQVHYPTPTAELAAALAARSEPAALRHLAEARLALGDRPAAVAALERWATASGAEAWDEAARWCARHHEWPAAFRAAEQALSGLAPSARQALVASAVEWANAHPEQADPLVWRARHAQVAPTDSQVLEAWIRALQAAGKHDEAQAALEQASALAAETRRLIRSDLLAERGQTRAAFDLLDAALGDGTGVAPSVAGRRTYAQRVDAGQPGLPETWRATLERAWDARALVRLHTYFQGQGRGDAAADLLRQVERRHERGLDRKGWLLVARLHGEIDAVPEAFRARLAAAHKASADEQLADLAELTRLALRAGSRPLAWGQYNDVPYRWAASLDRTPGFWTGGVAFLMTGQDWQDALDRLESESLPERTFSTARALLAELARRAPQHAELAALRAATMARHVERGEGQKALDLLAAVEAGPPEIAAEGRRVALLAARQVELPLQEEARLYRAQLRRLASDGSQPSLESDHSQGWTYEPPEGYRGFERRHMEPAQPSYKGLLDEAVARLDERDGSHRAALDLLLGELERLPDAEALWLHVAERLQGWHLDDELGPRYERALQRFSDTSWWGRSARYLARRKRQADLRRLAEELAQRFQAAEIFTRTNVGEVGLEITETGARVRLVPWADWVRLQALKRFPHSPKVYAECVGRLMTREELQAGRWKPRLPKGQEPVIVEAALMKQRREALLFVDAGQRTAYLDAHMQDGSLEATLQALEARTPGTPVEQRLLFEGWARLSQFERAATPADALASAYPGEAAIAQDVLALHRSLARLDGRHALATRTLVERSAPALEDPNALWTELGEVEQERGRADAARAAWAKLLEREPRNPARVEELATLLWDYGYMREALDVVEQGRKRLARPRLLAFEAGVLREELRDIDGAVREYLAGGQPDEAGDDSYVSYYSDQRALRRLSQLLARPRVRALVLRSITALRPGQRADEQTLVALFPLAQIGMPDDTLDWTADDWIDGEDLPNDPVGRAQRLAARADWRPQARAGFVEVGSALLAKSFEMLPKGTDVAFLERLGEWQSRLLDARWGATREVDFENGLRARRAALAASDEQRVALEVERATFLFARGRRADADALWSTLQTRIGSLPQGAPRLHAEAERAAYLERSQGVDAAAREWQALTQRYPWSLGLLEDRLAFLARQGRGAEARQALEGVSARAASGHREALLQRLASEALEARDLAQARRAIERLLGEAGLDAAQRLGAAHLLARLSLRENSGADLLALAKSQQARLEPTHAADVYAQLARAAYAERQDGIALTLWIEALNRRLERGFIREAWRAAERGSKSAELQAFFEAQRARSPRDVRWAVAVRELRLLGHDLDGAIQFARQAVDVRPERESLWREAAELMERAGRPQEAADYLAGWARPRPADEGVAGWRSRLYADAGDAARALATEQAALQAFAREARGDDRDEQLAERRARAARRLIEQGLPQQALTLATAGTDVAGLAASKLSWSESADLALATGRLVRFLRQYADTEEARSAAAEVLASRGRPEQREEVLGWLLERITPTPKVGTPTWPPASAGLRLLWDFAGQAELQPALRLAWARRYLAVQPGPWAPEPPVALLEAVGAELVTGSAQGLVFASPEVEPKWAAHLAARDDGAALLAWLAPRLGELVTQVAGSAPVPRVTDCKKDRPRNWTRWLDAPDALETFVRAAAARPGGLAELTPAFRDRARWNRLWALGACGWKLTPLLEALPDDARQAWFRMWQQPSPLDADPLMRARGETVERTSQALARLLAGAPDAANDPALVRLRGPRSVGAWLDDDARFKFAEFAPRDGTSDTRANGRGHDSLRFPAALWGERPGTSFFVLEALLRWRSGDRSAVQVPLAVPERGREQERAELALRLADALGDTAGALRLAESYPQTGADLERLGAQLRRLLRDNQKEAAESALAAQVRRRQASVGPDEFRNLTWLAEDLGLGAPLRALDASQPLSPALLAYVYDRFGPALGARYRTSDPADFRSALHSRWAARERSLNPEECRAWLRELWAHGAAELPRAALPKLGGLWPRAADWLAELPQSTRAQALEAFDALPDTSALDALAQSVSDPRSDGARLLRLRLRLLRKDEAGASAQLDELLTELQVEPPLSYAPVTLSEHAAEDAELEEYAGADESAPETPAMDPFAARLAAWLQPFREARLLATVGERVRLRLRERRLAASEPVATAALRLEFELTPGETERAALLQDIEHAYIRGDYPAWRLNDLVELLCEVAPSGAARWIARVPRPATFADSARRARWLAKVDDHAAAAAVLIQARRRGNWSTSEELQAFDHWRRLRGSTTASSAVTNRPGGKGAASASTTAAAGTGPSAPATWTTAAAFWRRPAGEIMTDLGRQLGTHAFDVLSARAALRSAAPADEHVVRLVLATRANLPGLSDDASDDEFLMLRAARGLAPRSARAALRQFPGNDPHALAADLTRRRLRAAEIEGVLSELARLHARQGARPAALQAVDALEARRLGEPIKLRAELQGLLPAPVTRTYRVGRDGDVQALRPMHLDWPLLAALLKAEATR
jgi:hypothetical protein